MKKSKRNENLAKKKWKKQKKGKNEKLDLNFASLCLASKPKLLNRSEAKNVKRKKAKKAKKMRKITKKSEKKKKSEKIDLNFTSLCFASKWKLLKWSEAKIWSENKRKEAKKEKWNFTVK